MQPMAGCKRHGSAWRKECGCCQQVLNVGLCLRWAKQTPILEQYLHPLFALYRALHLCGFLEVRDGGESSWGAGQAGSPEGTASACFLELPRAT